MSTAAPRVPYDRPRLSPAEALARSQAFEAQLSTRRSIRDFSADPVPRALIEGAIRTAGSAPSGAHQQPWTFVAVSQPAMKRRIRIAAEVEEHRSYEGGRMPDQWREALAPIGTDWRKPFLETVPWIVVLFAQQHGFFPDGSLRRHYYAKESVGIAAGLFIAALHQAGLSTLTHTPSPMTFLSRLLGRPGHERPFLLFPIGYPAPGCTVPDLHRKGLDELCIFDPTLPDDEPELPDLTESEPA